MSITNWTKQAAPGQQDNNGAYAATATMAPATEAELEAMRYRGTPLNRTAPPAATNHHHASPVTPGRHNERIQAINEAVRDNCNCHVWIQAWKNDVGI